MYSIFSCCRRFESLPVSLLLGRRLFVWYHSLRDALPQGSIRRLLAPSGLFLHCSHFVSLHLHGYIPVSYPIEYEYSIKVICISICVKLIDGLRKRDRPQYQEALTNNELERFITSCWHHVPVNRPSFTVCSQFMVMTHDS